MAHLAARQPKAETICHKQTHRRDDVETPLRGRREKRESQESLIIREPVRSPKSHLIPVEQQPCSKSQDLSQNRHIHTLNPATKRQIPKQQGKEHGEKDGRGERKSETLIRHPEEGQCFDLVPDHKIRQRLAVFTLLGAYL